ncbi:MAG: HPr family phosphocarrier protein [Ruthenibacterium sp.]
MTCFTYTLQVPEGLHARPAGVLAARLQNETCNVTVCCGMRKANAKGLLSLMCLAAKCGETVTVKIEGENERALAQELAAFFAENF